MSGNDLGTRRKNWNGGAMDPKGVDEEFRSIRRGLSNSVVPLQTLVVSLSADVGILLTSPFVTMASSTTLTAERVLTGTANEVTVTDNGANSTVVLSVPDPFNSPGVVNVPNTKLEIGSNQVFPILQILKFTTTTVFATTSSTFTNTNLTGAITPKFNTSKILVIGAGDLTQDAGDDGCATLARGGTNLAPTGDGFHASRQNNNYYVNMMFYDSPATTSSTTYSVQIRSNAGGSNARFPSATGSGNIGTAVLILVEIAQ